ncbi:hypothetical protein I317_05821 [Kwoniella heveanensis CBS 569]|nr:hypothetical protein I317_05821 [Kwoniella heveanensis CBS 569]
MTDQSSSGWVTTTSSYASSNPNQGINSGAGMAGGGGSRERPVLAWAGVRHQGSMRDIGDSSGLSGRVGGEGGAEGQGKGAGAEEEEKNMRFDLDGAGALHCSQAVLITCLHLSHEMGQRDVGMYGWTTPMAKDPMGSMIKIMKQYSGHIRALSKHDLSCRSVPDPSKTVIQHHLQRARLAAGQNSYVAVIYNGHGIQEPPTEQGELWCYDKGFDECLQSGSAPSEYIPIMLFDVMAWAGASTCWVWDCSHAGRIIRAAHSEAEEIDNQYRAAAAQNPNIAKLHPPVYSRRQIHFAACSAGQTIPRVHGMPDDLFTACLTTPLRIALFFHNLQTFPLTKGDGGSFIPRTHAYMAALWENMSQNLKDRLWYELSAITHTIAWQTIEGWEYQKLFGVSGDVVGNFASGFLLSQRVLGAYKTTPESIPSIPSSTGHALWTTWDLILDNLFEQLPKYFDEGVVDTSWEKDLKLVSFMADQLESITTAGQRLHVTEAPRSGMTPGLTRLPIICSAAMTSGFRVQASTVLDSCLRALDVRGLAHAVQGGALDVAAGLLELEDPEIKAQVISIWSSLVQYDVAVLALAKDGLSADRLTEVPAVRFFLSALEESLGQEGGNQDDHDPTSDSVSQHSEEAITTLIIQTAAVLSTIANHVKGRTAPRFVLRTISMVGVMLRSKNALVQQWGAMLIAEVLGSLDRPEEAGVIDGAEVLLLRMIESDSVESRATAVYALSRWVPLPLSTAGSDPHPHNYRRTSSSSTEVNASLELAGKLVEHAFDEGSSLVRRELARMFVHVLQVCMGHTKLATWVFILRRAILHLPELRSKIEGAIKATGSRLGIIGDQLKKLKVVQRVLDALRVFSFDPDAQVSAIVFTPLQEILVTLASGSRHEADAATDTVETRKPDSRRCWEALGSLCFPGLAQDASQEGLRWTEEMVDHLISSAEMMDNSRDGKRLQGRHMTRRSSGKTITDTDTRSDWRWNTDLFDKTKLSLQAYLAAGRSRGTIDRSSPQSHSQSQCLPEKVVTSYSGDSKERTFIMRHRLLEDSLVVAEQQVGLPWKWRVKDITSPDPWTTMTLHSFHPIIMSCNGSNEILFFDWGNAKKTGSINLNIITSARFVNELHEQIVVVAEINNGDIHILAGPSGDPNQIKPIACFHALDLDVAVSGHHRRPRGQKRMVNTWFRSSGLLCVGGQSDKINVWDCPAERCVKHEDRLGSGTGGRRADVTTLITEPVSGNLILSGLSDGTLQLYDLRQARKTALLSWRGDVIVVAHDGDGCYSHHSGFDLPSGRSSAMKKVGVILGESKNITSACANGLINTYDLRKLSEPISSVLAHQDGIAAASFQGHSGLLSTVSNLERENVFSTAAEPQSGSLGQAGFPSRIRTQPVVVDWAIHRSALGQLSEVTKEQITFPNHSPSPSPEEDTDSVIFNPYTVFHPLRPFVSIGHGNTCYLRGCGVGEGDDTDSGSYSFLRSQAGLD